MTIYLVKVRFHKWPEQAYTVAALTDFKTAQTFIVIKNVRFSETVIFWTEEVELDPPEILSWVSSMAKEVEQ